MNELPLQHFFDQLQKNDQFLVGIDEYKVLLEVLMHSVRTAEIDLLLDQTKLLNLCKTLWLKPGQNEAEFEKLFHSSWQMPTPELTNPANITGNQENTSSPSTTQSDAELGTQTPESTPKNEKTPAKPTPSPAETQTYRNVYLNFNQSDGAETMQPMNEKKHFHFTQNYVPYKKRNIAQIWRSFNGQQQTMATNQIDVEATIEKKCRQRFIQQPVYRTITLGQAQLVTLIEHKGGMIAFKHFAQAFAQSAVDYAAIQNAIYYFSKAPTYLNGDYYLFLNQQETEFRTLTEILKNQPKTPAILIISDAGATSNAVDIDRLEKTEQFLNSLKKITHKVAWLNPMPADRWEDTSAAIIAKLIPCYETSLEGLKKAMGVLRGKKIFVAPNHLFNS